MKWEYINKIKKTLHPLDTKQWITDNGKDTKFFGHCQIENEKNNIINNILAELHYGN